LHIDPSQCAWRAYARLDQSAIPEALRFLGRKGNPQAIVKRPLGELPEYTPRVQASVWIGCSQSFQRTPKGNSADEIATPQHLTKFFVSNCLVVQWISEASETAALESGLSLLHLLYPELREQSVTVLPSRSAIVSAFGELLQELDHLETFEDRREFLESTVSRIETDGETVTINGTITTQGGAHGHQKNCNCRLDADTERQRCHGDGGDRGIAPDLA
jgi:hypothetical protein